VSRRLRNRSAALTAGIRALLSGERIDASAAEVTLGHRLDQYHMGVVCWAAGGAGAAEISWLERAISKVAAQAGCQGDPLFVAPRRAEAATRRPLSS
jgi:hypothetical protein